MPNIGDRVFVRPRHGQMVQRGDNLFGQFVAQEGQEVTYDSFIARRVDDGALDIVVEQPAQGVPPAADEVA